MKEFLQGLMILGSYDMLNTQIEADPDIIYFWTDKILLKSDLEAMKKLGFSWSDEHQCIVWSC